MRRLLLLLLLLLALLRGPAAADSDPLPPWTPEQEALLQRFAPILVQAVSPDPVRRRWDFPVTADFDGDYRGNNNEESLRFGSRPLEAALYAEILETGTHAFLTYAVFHPLDWSPWPALVPYAWHENDMGTLQVVIRKGAEGREPRVELASAQGRVATAFAAPEGAGAAGWRLARAPLRLLDTAFGPGERVAIRSERGSHDLSFLPGDFPLGNPQDTSSACGCMVLAPGAAASEYRAGRRVFAYRLHSLREAFWKPFVLGQALGDGGLMDGAFDFRGRRMLLKGLPRHLDADRRSAPWRRDRAYLPFAFGTSMLAGDLGSLFLDPAARYPEVLSLPAPWDTAYARHPYRDGRPL